MSDREAERKAFILKSGWDDAAVESFPGDASTRRYFRLTRGNEVAVLMDAPRGAEAPAEPEGASPAERKALGYNALARLAGPEPAAFACLSNELVIRGFSAPKILAADLDAGLLLLEDFGRNVYAKAIEKDPAMEAPLYFAAAECLGEIYRSSFPAQMQFGDISWRVRDYDDVALLAETDLFLDWYAPDAGLEVSDDMRSEFYGLYQQSFRHLKAHASGLALRDFHAENLFWLPERESVAKVGLIDFQDGLFVHPAYDLMSLITDIRRDVSPALKDKLIEAFCGAAKIKNDTDFRAAYAVLSVQRGTKLLGFPVRADLKFGKPQYRPLLKRVKRHLNDDLAHPAVAPIRGWYARHLPEVLS